MQPDRETHASTGTRAQREGRPAQCAAKQKWCVPHPTGDTTVPGPVADRVEWQTCAHTHAGGRACVRMSAGEREDEHHKRKECGGSAALLACNYTSKIHTKQRMRRGRVEHAKRVYVHRKGIRSRKRRRRRLHGHTHVSHAYRVLCTDVQKYPNCERETERNTRNCAA